MTRGGKKLAWRIAASLGAGVVLTVAVAWGLKLRIDPTSTSTGTKQGGVPWPRPAPSTWPSESSEHPPAAAFGTRRQYHSTKDEIDSGQYLVQIRSYTMIVDQRGWPALALESRHVEAWQIIRRNAWSASSEQATLPVIESRWHRGVLLPASLRGLARQRLYLVWLPVLPLWPGFAINTAFYAGAVLLLWTAPGFVRRRRRLRRGQCPACGYDLCATPGRLSPECGA